MAIKLTVTKAPAEYDLAASKFFGSPTVPLAWENTFDEDELFLCQIKLSDIAPLDKENRLPQSGYLYVFLHTEDGDYSLRPDVRYDDGEPELAIDGFNSALPDYERYNDAYLIEFSETDDDSDCTRLFGTPSDWNYESEPPKLLLQFDPLDSEMGFLDHLDGYLYFFFGKDTQDFSAITLQEEYS